uniref:CBL-interacting protein kinase 33-like n=1 Tax=Phallusia mammillata TaxID=59560 RepID=A0A6F9DG68_9ASCI|nr:CBL-interacting protein kinase 33-like [Phallusia mammillata]
MTLQEYDAKSLKTSWNASDLVGHGGFAAVRKCRHKKLGEVAVKCFSTTGSTEKIEKDIEGQSREAKILSQIKHKNILRVHGITKWSNCFGVLMDFIEGGSLCDILQKNVAIPEIPWGLCVRMLKQLGDALCYLHFYDKNYAFVHGDLKPENILLTLELQVKLADFGSVNLVQITGASRLPSISVQSTTQHTRLYSAPEFLKDPQSKRTVKMDVYSFGMIIFEMITRKSIFHGVAVNMDVLIALILSQKQRPNVQEVEKIKNTVSKQADLQTLELMEKLMNLCWSQKPEDRPPMDNVRDELLLCVEKMDNQQLMTEAFNIRQKMISPKPRNPLETQVSLSQFANPFEKVENPGPFISTGEHIDQKDPTCFIALGGWSTQTDVLQYSPVTNTFTSLPRLNIGRWHLSAASVSEKLLAIGGKLEEDMPTNAVECLDLQKPTEWIHKSPMNENRYHACATTLGEYVYVSGGWNEMKICLSSIECYKLADDEWTIVGNMKTAREGHSLVACNGKLYIFGGYDGSNRLQSAECFDPTTCQSTYLSDMPCINSHHAASYLNGWIYQMGGLDGDLTFLRKVCRFNVAKNEWDSTVPNMMENRVSLGSCVVDGKLYAVGGRSYGDSMTTIESFDESLNKWMIVAQLEKPWYRHSVVAI